MREVAGLLIVFAVLAMAPAVMLSSRIWWVVAVSLVVVALLLFYTSRRVKRDRDAHATSNDTFDGYAPGPLSPSRGRRMDTDSGDADGGSDGD